MPADKPFPFPYHETFDEYASPKERGHLPRYTADIELADDGQCRLVVIRGRVDKKKLVGDAEQQAFIKAEKDESEGGEKELGKVHLSSVKANQWHRVKLRFQSSTITAFVDDKPVLTATDELYGHGMVGLLAGQEKKRTSTPYFDNLQIKTIDGPPPKPSTALPGQTPIYGE